VNPALERLILAWDACLQARGLETERLRKVYERLLQEQLPNHPGLTRDRLHQAVRHAYGLWARKQKHPPSIPASA